MRMLHQPQPIEIADASGSDQFAVGGSEFQDSNSIQTPSTSAEPSSSTPSDSSRSLKRVFLANRTVTCNDGSQAGFYLRKPLVKSKRWVVFLEGGWHCFDTDSCKQRWTKYRNLMTSAKWPETRDDVGGILSPLAAENPYWHNANHIFVPYCSSDSWSGSRVSAAATAAASDGGNITSSNASIVNGTGDGRWSFMGALIVRQVIADLVPLGLGRSQGGELMLAGSSAGGLGVMLNLDRVRRQLREENGVRMAVRGVSDSGWFLDREPFVQGALSTAEMVRLGHRMWQGLVPEACAAQFAAEPWRCYFGHRLYGTLKGRCRVRILLAFV